jgi:hypothetical protein
VTKLGCRNGAATWAECSGVPFGRGGGVVVCFRFVLNCPFASETLLPCEMRSDYELPLADHVKQSIRRLHLNRSPFLLVDDKGWTNTP